MILKSVYILPVKYPTMRICWTKEMKDFLENTELSIDKKGLMGDLKGFMGRMIEKFGRESLENAKSELLHNFLTILLYKLQISSHTQFPSLIPQIKQILSLKLLPEFQILPLKAIALVPQLIHLKVL